MTSSEIKKYLGGFSSPLLLGVLLSAFAFAFWYGVSGWKELQNVNLTRQITVSGEGKVAVKPDIATFTVGVVTQAKKIKDAQLENTGRSNAILSYLREQGIPEKDTKTTNYSIYPQYQYFDTPPCYASPCPPRKPPEITFYQVNHTLEVKVRDLDKVDELLEGVVASGANEVGSISFTVEDEKGAQEEARKKAIGDAEAKAGVLAQDLGVRLGRIVGFSESGGPFPIYARAFEAKGGFGGDVAPAPEVQPGEQEIRSTVTITYEFR